MLKTSDWEIKFAESPAVTSKNLKARRSLRILVAEDNLINQMVVSRVLQNFGHQICLVKNGEEAIREFQRQPYDVILMDIQMPVVGGEEATARIRALENGSKVPIVALTAHAMAGDREYYLAAGMDGYVTKPIRKEELFEVLEKLNLPETISQLGTQEIH